jgi:hypothetical protein
VDNSTFSITGASFAAIVSPHAASNTAVTLQKDDVSLAYEASCLPRPLLLPPPNPHQPGSDLVVPVCVQFARKFPGVRRATSNPTPLPGSACALY